MGNSNNDDCKEDDQPKRMQEYKEEYH